MLLLFLRSKRSSSEDEVVSLLWMACFFTLERRDKSRVRIVSLRTDIPFFPHEHITRTSEKLLVKKTVICWAPDLGFSVCPPYMASPRWGSVGVKKWGVALFSVHWLWKKGNKKWLVVTLWYNFHLLWFLFCLNYIWNQFRSVKNNSENAYIYQ